MRSIRQEQERRRIERERSELARNGEKIRANCQTLAGFVREAWHVLEPTQPYVHGWHIDAICQHLEAISNGTFLAMGLPNRLLINVPPGTMKSLLVSVFWPAWEWGPLGKPGTRYLATSYTESYVKRDSRRMRNLVNSDWFQWLWPEVKLTRSGEASFENNKSGSRDGVPFSSMTGGRGDRVIIDDPHSTETAESPAERERTTRIFRESVPSRLNNPEQSAIVVIMQRLHEADVSGQIKKLGLGYQHLMLPMRFEPERHCKTALGFEDPRSYQGELLFPERYSQDVIARDEKAMTSYAVAGQWQQRPVPRDGGMFKRSWFEVIRAVPAGTTFVRAWDLAGSTKKKSPYTAGVKIGKLPDGRFVVAHAVREQLSPADMRTTINNTASQDGKAVKISIPQDPGQAGKDQAQSIVRGLAGYNARKSPESGDKETRAEPFAAQAEAGNVLLLAGEWNEAYLEELALFPGGEFADQVDASSRAFNELTGTRKAPVARTGHYRSR